MIGKERDTELAMLIASNVQDACDAIAQQHIRDGLWILLETLTDKEEMVLQL